MVVKVSKTRVRDPLPASGGELLSSLASSGNQNYHFGTNLFFALYAHSAEPTRTSGVHRSSCRVGGSGERHSQSRGLLWHRAKTHLGHRVPKSHRAFAGAFCSLIGNAKEFTVFGRHLASMGFAKDHFHGFHHGWR